MAKECVSCGQKGGFLSTFTFVTIGGNLYCAACAGKLRDRAISGVIISSTPSLDGYCVKRYLGIESVEIVIGTGMFSEFSGDIADFFGARSTDFENKLQAGKQTAFDKLKFKAASMGGNAVIGIDIDYVEFTNNRIGVVANGTIVEVARLRDHEARILAECETPEVEDIWGVKEGPSSAVTTAGPLPPKFDERGRRLESAGLDEPQHQPSPVGTHPASISKAAVEDDPEWESSLGEAKRQLEAAGLIAGK